jgi:adhesin transport system outer membrane protein
MRTVRNLVSSRDLQRGLMDAQDQSVADLDELLASYRRQYVAGSKSWLDLLNMQRELTEQRLQLAQAQSDWLVYILKLAALTGQLDALASLEN